MGLIEKPTVVPAAGIPPKIIEEFVGRVNDGEGRLSLARMKSPPGWVEPGQTPDFDEWSLVLKGFLRVETSQGVQEVQVGQAYHSPRGQWIRYSTPQGAEYLSVCLPAFSMETVRRDD